MGSNSSVAHASYAVSPSVAVTVPELTAAEHLAEAIKAVGLAQCIAHGGADPDDPHGVPVVDLEPGDVAAQYAAFCEAASEARQHFAALQGTELLHTGEASAAYQELLGTAESYLGGLDPKDLQKLAAAQGFQCPELAGTFDNQSALAYWLNPNTADSGIKTKIQAKALERFDQMSADQTIFGLTLPDVTAPATKAADDGSWVATPQELEAARLDFMAKAKTLEQAAAAGSESAELVEQLLAAENKVFTAACPDLPADTVNKLKANVRTEATEALVTSQLPGVYELAKAAHDAGDLTLDESVVLSPLETVALLRASTPAVEAQMLKETATQRSTDLKKMIVNHSDLLSFDSSPSGAYVPPVLTGTKESWDELACYASVAGQYATAHATVEGWKQLSPNFSAIAYPPVAEMTSGFQDWAAAQKLSHLRKAAAHLGMTDTAHASRAQVSSWIAASWDPSGKEALQAVAANSPAAKPKVPVASSSATPSTAMGKPGYAAPHGFVAQHRELVAALTQAKATAADLPPRPAPESVASWTFGPGKSADLGGMHAKTLHQAPDGSMWLFKPDKTSGGARAFAEAAASQAFHAAGVASVPVFVKNIGSKTGSIQPLIGDAHQLPDSPGSWSQADVDAIVRFHVASWMVGDHDGKSDNVLRTPSGGLVPIDQGQAFKFWGHDKLAMDYHPNASYGAARPVFQRAYEAHLAGKLGKDVTVNPAAAHPVIKAFEAVPDTQWRKMLHDTAHQGAQHGVAWVPAMRKHAAKTHEITEQQVSTAQIAEAFLDHAVQRKTGLREAFAEFFTSEVKLSSGAHLKDGG